MRAQCAPGYERVNITMSDSDERHFSSKRLADSVGPVVRSIFLVSGGRLLLSSAGGPPPASARPTAPHTSAIDRLANTLTLRIPSAIATSVPWPTLAEGYDHWRSGSARSPCEPPRLRSLGSLVPG